MPYPCPVLTLAVTGPVPGIPDLCPDDRVVIRIGRDPEVVLVRALPRDDAALASGLATGALTPIVAASCPAPAPAPVEPPRRWRHPPSPPAQQGHRGLRLHLG